MTAAGARGKGALEVILFADKKFVGSLMFTGAQITIGRDRGQMVRLDDPAVSGEHAVLQFTGRSCVVEDLGSRNGVLVNGERVESQLVQPTDEITIAKFRMKIVIHRAEQAAPEPEPDLETQAPSDATQVVRAPAHWAAEEEPKTTPSAPLVEERKPRGTKPHFEGEDTDPDRAPDPRPKAKAPVAAPAPVAAKARAKTAAKTAPPAVEEAPRPAARVVEEAPAPTPPVEEIAPTPPAEKIAAPAPAAVERAPQPAAARSAKASVDAAPVAPEAAGPAVDHAALVEDDAPRAFEEDDEDEDFEPDFSLLDLLRSRAVKPAEASAPAEVLVEIIVARDERVKEISHLPVGGRLGWSGLVAPLAEVRGPRSVVLPLQAGVALELFDGERPVALGDEQRARGTAEVVPGGSAILRVAGDRVCVHFVPVAAPPREGGKRMVPTRSAIATTASSFALHFGVFLAIGIASIAGSTEAADLNEGRYAKVAIKDLELEAPAPKPPEPVPSPEKPLPTAEAVTVKQPKVRAPTVARTHAPTKAVAAAGPPGGGAPSAAASKALGALSAALAPSRSSSVASAATNLDAVGASRSGGGFKISGAIGKMPGDQLRMAAGGSGIGRVDTKSASELTRGGSVGKITGPGGGGGKVRALVTSPPARTLQVQGELDRGEIQKVVNAHLHEVQGCYERKLIKEPTLSGKLIYEWVITPSGSVGSVRVKFSDMRSTDVTTCIQSSISGWTFPQPRGGSVTVTYPFVFSTLGT